MNIFTNFRLTKYHYATHTTTTGRYPEWNTWKDNYRSTGGAFYYGVFKPRTTSDLYSEDVSVAGDATLNVKPDEPFIRNEKEMVGDHVQVESNNYLVSAVDTAINYRTGKIEHYRLHLKLLETAQ